MALSTEEKGWIDNILSICKGKDYSKDDIILLCMIAISENACDAFGGKKGSFTVLAKLCKEYDDGEECMSEFIDLID